PGAVRAPWRRHGLTAEPDTWRLQGDAAANRRGQERLPGSGVACGCRTTVHRSARLQTGAATSR
ncbi:hypothetical protein, partial [Pseudomonas aeruginosa]|uniref:hypothetical protein n=1 Tax=Pseudomonas aeruginosa TaxID=287 RepID=UPI001BD4AD2D